MSAWAHRKLIKRLTAQEIVSRYKGSALGFLWALVIPVLSIAVYYFVFTFILPSKWPGATGGVDFVFFLFIGLTLFSMFTDVVVRSPGLMLENVSYIKKVVFPVEILSVVSVLSACANGLLAFLVFFFFYVPFKGIPPWQIVFLPAIIFPYVVLMCGISWFFSSLGVYIRDLRHVVAPVANLLLFLSPVFFPSTALPESFQHFLYLNPITFIIEQSRAVAIHGQMPNLVGLAYYYVAAAAIAWLGLTWFTATRRGFADVV